MMENKQEPLNVNSGSNPKGRQGSVRKKRPEHKKRKLSKNIKIYAIIAFVVFAIIFCALAFFIYKNLRTISELKDVLETRKKELEAGDKTRIELLEKIDSVEKQIELKKRYVKEKKEIDAQKLEEYNEIKKIYENIEEMQNKINEENQYSLVLDETINILNSRINNLSKK